MSSQSSRRLNESIDRLLLERPPAPIDAIVPWARLDEPAALADRVRRRATRLAKVHRAEVGKILQARDRIVLTLYHLASPPGCFSGWCDGSIVPGDGQRGAGIGAVLMAPGGELIAEFARAGAGSQSFEVEIEAVLALLHMGREYSVRRISVHTDCHALVQRWSMQRDDVRLQRLRGVVKDYEFFKMNAVPPRHNRPAHRLARAATATPAAESGFVTVAVNEMNRNIWE